MGCGSSKAVIVPSATNIEEAVKSPNEDERKKKTSLSSRGSRVSVKSDGNNDTNSNVNDTSGKIREISASSTRTADSGISDLPDDGMITENSNPNKLIQVESSQRPATPDLTLEGVPCPRKQSGKEKRRLELQKRSSESSVPTFPPITNGGLVERPKTRGGLAFDITFCPETGNMRKAQLPKLERRKKKKKLTKEELEEKMRKAAERRQEHNKKIQEKSHAFVQQYENVVQRKQNSVGITTEHEENLDIARDDEAEIF
ncbi:uncharacterized protein LOC114528844 [Dendronephthya gigantea]|uniref:uncharacterized protein LOC114528844 n=1 Tax=Dendronephthya gigantea TaxID=151771 RepID=UPI00106CEC99|nr:uncharacterized protein LOC114528844 [Dendronephthya gigantea]